MHFNVYLRKDGRYEGRLPRGKKENGKRQFLYFFGKTLDEVYRKMKAEKHIIPSFGTIQADCLTSDKIYLFIKEKQAAGLSNRYISDILILMKSVYKYGVSTYHINNPMEGITMPKKKRQKLNFWIIMNSKCYSNISLKIRTELLSE